MVRHLSAQITSESEPEAGPTAGSLLTGDGGPLLRPPGLAP
jgi:hypothetical protein